MYVGIDVTKVYGTRYIHTSIYVYVISVYTHIDALRVSHLVGGLAKLTSRSTSTYHWRTCIRSYIYTCTRWTQSQVTLLVVLPS
jgi:hypothetical protein